MQLPFELRKEMLKKALGIGALAGGALAATGLDPDEGEAATLKDYRNVARVVNRNTATFLNADLKGASRTVGRNLAEELKKLNKIPEETIRDVKVRAVERLPNGWAGGYSPIDSEITIPKAIHYDSGVPGATRVVPHTEPASALAHETGHHWQFRKGMYGINIGASSDDPYKMAEFLPSSLIPEVLNSKSIPGSVKNKVVDLFHSMYKDPDEVAIALQELSFATKTSLHTPGEVLSAVYDATVMEKFGNVPTAKKYFEKLGKYMLAVPSIAALAVGIDTALQATDQGSMAEAMPIGKLLKAGSPLAQKVVKGDVGVGGLSKVMKEAKWFTFPAGPYKGKTIQSVVKSANSKTFYLQFEDDTVGRIDKEEAKLLAQNLGIRRYLDIWEARTPADKKLHAKGIALEKATRNRALSESPEGIPAAAQATPLESLEKVHKMGLEIHPYKQVEYKGQIFDLPTQYANLLLSEGIVTIPGEKLMLTGAARARAARVKG